MLASPHEQKSNLHVTEKLPTFSFPALTLVQDHSFLLQDQFLINTRHPSHLKRSGFNRYPSPLSPQRSSTIPPFPERTRPFPVKAANIQLLCLQIHQPSPNQAILISSSNTNQTARNTSIPCCSPMIKVQRAAPTFPPSKGTTPAEPNPPLPPPPMHDDDHKGSSPRSAWVLPGAVIVGAGPSGLATAACLSQHNVPYLMLERETCVGSSWKLRMYDRLRLHLPKEFCELPLMGFPRDFPTYPTKRQFVSYLDEYARRFQIEPAYGVEVRRAEYEEGVGMWRVVGTGGGGGGGEVDLYCRWLVVATGENAEKVVPEVEGMGGFQGRVVHTSCYSSAEEFAGQRVLVVGCGNSGMEVCLDLCDRGARTSLVVRDEVHILPREMFGVSTFGLSMWLLKWLPIRTVDAFLLFFSRIILGDMTRFGLRRPRIGPLQLKNMTGKTPVLDVGALGKIKTGQVKVVPGIRRFTANGVEFVDGRRQEFDSIILATGYRSNVPAWLKEGEFFDKKDGFPRNPFPNSWKGINGLYATGFTKKGLLGAAMDARRIADHIACQWRSETKHHPF